MAWTHPQMIGRNGPNLGYKQVRADLLSKPGNRFDSFNRVMQGYKIFCLQLFATARGKTHFKMWQSLVPWPRDTHLISAAFRRMVHNRVQVFGGGFRSIKFRFILRFIGSDAALDPNLVYAVALPVGK